ncbi:MAG: HlyD family efflux transporter periplasmic adaptor subunit [Planctomycetaceae bacterium]|nr:HlyD family efflux transporter periplasmic adaptor subunit [Planctomycetales bacterium]MCB9921326.1 HlyD family efflux transporter periplasmic adaptor subunit [Planctomycetaceae bacterium]
MLRTRVWQKLAKPCTRRRLGSASLFVLVGLVIIAVGVGIAWLAFRKTGPDAASMPLLAEVTRGTYDHIVLEEGEVESSNNVEIRCLVRARSSGSGPATSIIDVIPEGSHVKEGDWLITFDSSAIEQESSRQRIVVNTAEATMIQAQATYDTALIAREEYLSGTYNEQRKMIENEIFVAEENLKKAQLSYDSIKRLVSQGVLKALQLEGEEFRVDAAKNELDLAKQKLKVLDDFTKKKMLTQLESDIKAAEVKFRNEKDSFEEEKKNLQEIQDQLLKCKAVAPADGQVVYANVQSSRSGSEFVVEPGVSVRENQVIIRLPDPKSMQIKAKIAESRITLVHEGMPVTIRIDAFGDETVPGEVTKVNKYAEPGNFWSASAKEYVTLIKILEPPPELRVGLTAEVQIHVEHRDDALQVPVQAVYERLGKTFCLVKNGEKWDTREIVIGSTNDKVVAVDEKTSEALVPGDEVVLNPRKHLDKFDQSRFPEPGEVASDEIASKVASSPTATAPTAESGPPGGGAGRGPGGGGRGGNPTQMIQRMDKNSDGKLSADELPEQMRSRLSSADTNGDGFYDEAELTAAFANMGGGGGGGGGGARPDGGGGGPDGEGRGPGGGRGPQGEGP